MMVGNCQAETMGRLILAMNPQIELDFVRLQSNTLSRIRSGEARLSSIQGNGLNFGAHLGVFDLVLLQNGSMIKPNIEEEFPEEYSRVRLFPKITFSAFHPDMIRIGEGVASATGALHSSIACYGWTRGLSVQKTVDLFTEEVFEALGFFDYWDASARFLCEAGITNGLPLEDFIKRWTSGGVWMHTINHPTIHVLADLARVLLAREGISFAPEVERTVNDDLADGITWEVYPQIARRLGCEGSYRFKRGRRRSAGDQAAAEFDLESFVDTSFKKYAQYGQKSFDSPRLASARYRVLEKFVRSRPRRSAVAAGPGPAAAPLQGPTEGGSNPYHGLPDHRFWRRAIERPPMGEVDPVVRPRFRLQREDKVATAGSCFAQHISRTLVRHGFNYYVPESGGPLPDEEAQRRNYGVFSARFGNLYTTRQLVQLFDRAYGRFAPVEDVWIRGDGRFVDPFRPQIEPDGFATVEELEQSRDEQFKAVREMFEQLDVFVFTMGLTEAWRSRVDGAVYPLAPGVAGGQYDAGRHEFVNFTAAEVAADMQAFVRRLLRANPRARMILTVSPVPLIATYEDRHVLVSTTYSKSALRVAAEEVCRRNPTCDYFPSYEIITGNFTRSEYYKSDLRSVNQRGLDHVMRLFLTHYSSEKADGSLDEELMRENAALAEVVCDEEAIDP